VAGDLPRRPPREDPRGPRGEVRRRVHEDPAHEVTRRPVATSHGTSPRRASSPPASSSPPPKHPPASKLAPSVAASYVAHAMPSISHQGLVELFRSKPRLALELLRDALAPGGAGRAGGGGDRGVDRRARPDGAPGRPDAAPARRGAGARRGDRGGSARGRHRQALHLAALRVRDAQPLPLPDVAAGGGARRRRRGVGCDRDPIGARPPGVAPPRPRAPTRPRG
jgi:hypothetical protein